jgi:cytochrome c oxidase subunit 4
MVKQHKATAGNKSQAIKHILAFVVMIILTAIAFYLVANNVVTLQALIPILLVLAVIQVILQLFIFMHLDQKGSGFPILFMVAGIVIAVVSAVGILLM